MFKAKIQSVTKNEEGMAVSFEVVFTDGTNTKTRTFDYAKYGFLTEEDILNFLVSECDFLDSKYAGVKILESFVEIEDVAAKIKDHIKTKKSIEATETVKP